MNGISPLPEPMETRNRFKSFIERYEIKQDAIFILGLIIAFLVIFREVLFYPKLIFVTDFSIPGSSPYYHILYFITGWAPHNMGFASTPGIGGLFTGFWVFLSGGNQVLSQKFMISFILFSSIFMYYFITKHITRSKFSGFIGGILYGYSPVVIDNFSAQFLWGYAFLPLILLFYFNIVKNKPKIVDSVALAFLIALSSSLMPHLLGLLPILFVIFFLVNLVRNRSSLLSYFKGVLKYFSITAIVYLLLSLQSYAFSVLMGKASALSFVAPPKEQFFLNYSGLSLINIIRLTGIGNPDLHPIHYLFLQSNGLGFILPFLVLISFFSFLRIKRNSGNLSVISLKNKYRVHVVSFSAIVVLFVLFVETIRYKSFLFDWIYAAYPLVITLRNPLSILMVISFSFSTLIGISSTYLQGLLGRFVKKIKLPRIALNKNVIGLITALLIIGSYFCYAPVYSASLQEQTPYIDYPTVYNDVINWMRTQGTEGSFRYLLVPQSHSSQLILPNNYPYQFLAVSGSSYKETYDFVHSTYDLISTGNSSTVGSLLAAGNVRYVILVKNTTEFSHVQWLSDGPVRVIGDSLVGNSTNFEKVFDEQNDLKLVQESADYLIYEVQNSLSRISVFPNAVYVIGDLTAIPQLNLLPEFQLNNNIIIFNGSQPLNNDPNLNLIDTILFYNLNNSQIDSSLSTLPARKQFVVMNTNPVFDKEFNSVNTTLLAANFTNAVNIAAGTGSVSYNEQIKPANESGSVIYAGKSGSDTLFTIVYDSQNTLDLSKTNELHYYFKLDGAREVQNVEFGLLDDSLNARRWFPNILPTVTGNEWQEITINLTSYSQQDLGFDISRVKKIQFTTYTSQPEEHVSMCVSDVIGTECSTINYSSTVRLPKDGNWFLKFKSAESNLNVTINDYPIRVVDGNNGWWTMAPFSSNNSYSKITITMPENSSIQEFLLSTTETPFSMSNNSNYSIQQLGDNKYRLGLNTEQPVYIYLGESYHQNWVASINGKKLDHFQAFSWCNGFYVNQTGQIEIEIEFDDGVQHILNTFTLGTIFGLPILLLLNQFDVLQICKKKFDASLKKKKVDDSMQDWDNMSKEDKD